jgi:DNA-binding MarR family transcriptional regulator
MQDKSARFRTSAGYALVRAFRTLNRETSRALLPFGISAEQAHILVVLWFEGPLKVGELQRSLALGSGTLTGAIDRMIKSGLVRRVQDPSDGRSYRIEPAPIDRRQKAAIIDACEKVERDVLAELSAREERELFRLLSKITGEGST